MGSLDQSCVLVNGLRGTIVPRPSHPEVQIVEEVEYVSGARGQQQVVRHATASLTLVGVMVATACATSTPGIDGGSGVPPSPSTLWPVPAEARTPAPPPAPPAAPAASGALSRDVPTAVTPPYSLADVVDLALRNNPATRESWMTARATADAYGATRGTLLPTVTGEVDLSRSKGTASVSNGTITQTGTGQTGTGTGTATGTTTGTTTGTMTGTVVGTSSTTTTTVRSQIAPSASLSYLLFDFGGRAGSIEAARQRAIAADLTHNATVLNAVLQVESALFSFLATRALRDAQVSAVNEAKADLASATERKRLGVATLEEVLQTQTALSQAQYQLATYEGNLLAARGDLAVAMGLEPNARFDVPDVTISIDSVATVMTTVDTLVNRAITQRSEIAEARAEAAELAADVRVARAAGFPTLTLRSTASYLATTQSASSQSHSFSVVLGVQIPIFNGFATQYNTRAAREQYEAGLARVESVQQQVTLQVFTSYYALQAAAGRVRSAADLLHSAEQSAVVASARYKEGVGTIVDVLLARSALETARAEAIQSRWEWRTALVQLGHDAGSLDIHGHSNLPLGFPPAAAQ